MKKKIIALLKEANDYVSGQELCEKFNVSRNAIWKTIEQLKKEGYNIEAVRNRGYRLSIEDADVYSQIELSTLLETEYIGRNSFYFDSVGSTNTEVKNLAEEGAPEGTLVFADQQIAGKGRRGRAWISPSGKNIYFSLMLRPKMPADKAPMLTLVMATAVYEGIRQECSSSVLAADDIQIKWPNDIVINGKKVCGMLTEMSIQEQDIQYVVIGVGINVKHQDFDADIQDKATCLDDECGKITNRCRLIASIMKYFEKYYEEFIKDESLDKLKTVYESHLANIDKEVNVLDPKGEFRGIARGINENGELLVETEDGKTVTVYAGEVSVRGIYGYV